MFFITISNKQDSRYNTKEDGRVVVVKANTHIFKYGLTNLLAKNFDATRARSVSPSLLLLAACILFYVC